MYRNKDELSFELLQKSEIVVFGCPKENFTSNEARISSQQYKALALILESVYVYV